MHVIPFHSPPTLRVLPEHCVGSTHHHSNLLHLSQWVIINFLLFLLSIEAVLLLFVSLFLSDLHLLNSVPFSLSLLAKALQGGFSSPTRSPSWSAVLGSVSCPQALTDHPPMWAQLPLQTPPYLLILPALLFIPSLQFGACLPPASLTRRPVSPVCLSQPWWLSPPPASELPLSSENCLEFLLLKCFLICGETTFSSSFQQAALKASSACPWEARSPPRPCTASGRRPLSPGAGAFSPIYYFPQILGCPTLQQLADVHCKWGLILSPPSQNGAPATPRQRPAGWGGQQGQAGGLRYRHPNCSLCRLYLGIQKPFEFPSAQLWKFEASQMRGFSGGQVVRPLVVVTFGPKSVDSSGGQTCSHWLPGPLLKGSQLKSNLAWGSEMFWQLLWYVLFPACTGSRLRNHRRTQACSSCISGWGWKWSARNQLYLIYCMVSRSSLNWHADCSRSLVLTRFQPRASRVKDSIFTYSIWKFVTVQIDPKGHSRNLGTVSDMPGN